MNFKKCFVAMAAFLLMLSLTVTGTVSADEQRLSENHKNLTSEKEEQDIPLRIIGDKDKILEDATVTISKDGLVSIKAHGVYESTKPAKAYDFSIDVKQETLTLEAAPAIQEPMPEHNSIPTGESTDATFIGIGQARVRVVGKDPVFIVVNESTDYLYWHRFNNGTVTWIDYTDNCYAANPTPAGTHWFTTSCSGNQPWYVAGNVEAVNDVFSEYINWDFWSNAQSTSMSHFIQIVGQNDGQYRYSWNWNAWGEASALLRGTLYLN